MDQIVVITLFDLFTVSGFAQENRLIERNNIGYYTYNGDHKFTNR